MFTYTGVNPGIPVANAPNILGRNYKMTAEVDVPQGGGNGVIATLGGRWGGWGLYLLNGKPVFNYNMLILKQYRWEGADALTPGKHTIEFNYTYDGPGIAKGGSGVLKVDGQEVAALKIPKTIPFLLPGDETFDIGSDTRTGVDDSYELPFHFTGTIDKLTFKLGPSQMTAANKKAAADAIANVNN